MHTFLKIYFKYSAPYEVVPYTEEPFSHHWFTPQPPRFQGLLFIGPPIAHKNIFAQLPKKWANETEQPSPPSSPAEGRRATEQKSGLQMQLQFHQDLFPNLFCISP